MAMFHLLKIRTSIDICKNEKCKVTFGLEYICKSRVQACINQMDVLPWCKLLKIMDDIDK